MKPEFALSLTHEGIGLLQRSEDGWLTVGTVSLKDADVEAALTRLRETAERVAKDGPVRSKLILPNTEVLYLDVDVGGATGPDYEATIREALDGRTPYALDELSYDYVVTGKTAQIAVVARETLLEAEAFAQSHAFNPVSFAAIPPKGAFSGEPMFGTTQAAVALLPGDMTLERDTVPVVVVGTAPTAPLGQTDAGPDAKAVAPDAAPKTKTEPPSKVAKPPVAAVAARAPSGPAKPVTATRPRAAEKPVPAPRPKAGLGLVVTAGALAVLLLIGLFAALRGEGDGAPPPVSQSEPAEDQSRVAPAPSVAATDPVDTSTSLAAAPQVMPEMEGAFEAPRPTRSTPFDQVPLPEEVAEGEEASTPGTTNTTVATATPDELAPAPVAGAGPGLLETETFYAVTGIWQRSPEALPVPRAQDLGDLYVASLDGTIAIDDALALPSYEEERDGLFETPQPPIGPGLVFDFDEDGRVVATPEGALTPDGVLVYSEANGVRPLPRPFDAVPQTDQAALATIRPAPRPENARELVERAVLDGRTRAELAAFSPRARPPSLQDEALAATDGTPSALAVAQAPSPAARPTDIERIVASVRAAQASQPERPATTAAQASLAAAPAPQQQTAPAIPTQASVARQATLENAMRLDRINLIGVYGTASERRALVRTKAGRYVKLQVGDRFDGGRVASIDEASLQYTKGGRNITLKMPNS
ncbi:hypothetical protein [Tropicimonas sp. S265A]|uniref:hypothetical protein n=1 Tax=Tropicimonas sp. S265A TaxID=3415134 RepID=UPI003C7A313B